LEKREDVRFTFIVEMGGGESDSPLNQLLVEMDGFGSQNNVVVFAATNRKDVLDSALTRTGRFDRSIEFTNPDIKAREQIYMVHLAKIKISEDPEKIAKRMSSLSPGFSGADIRNVCNEAAINAARREAESVEMKDFELAIERVIGGLERNIRMSDAEKKLIAIHECGHAVVSWFLEHASPLLKLTVIPRAKGSLGFAQYLPSESSLETETALKHRIAFTLGGRCAEEEFFGEVTTGAQDDLKKAYQLANTIVTKVGMSKSLYNESLITNEYGFKKYSENTSKLVDQEILEITTEAYNLAKGIVKDKRSEIEK